MTEDKKQLYLNMFNKRLNELKQEAKLFKNDPDKLDKISKEEYAYQQEIRMLTEEKKEEPKTKKRRKRWIKSKII